MPRNRILRLEERPAASFRANPSNWRLHPQAQREAIAGALDEVGWAGAALVNLRSDPAWGDERGVETTVDGHARVEDALARGPDTPVPTLICDLSPSEERLILATLDPIGAMAQVDQERLDALIASMQSPNAAISRLLDSMRPVVPAQDTPTQEPTEEPRTSTGQVWIMRGEHAEHHLLVGDSRSAAGLTTEFLAGVAPALQIVDPPFDFNYDEWALHPSTVVAMVWRRGSEALRWEASALIHAEADWGVHELVFTGGVRGWPNDWLPVTVHDTVDMWRRTGAKKSFDRDVLNSTGARVGADGTRPYSVQEHAGGVLTGYGGMSWGKALVAMELAMAYIGRGDTVWDPCAGSGTSLIAAEKHGRRWLGAEIQPRWADLTLKRWESSTGRTAQASGTIPPPSS